jgi:hypothetical protein
MTGEKYTNGDIQRLHERIDTLQTDIHSQLKAGTAEIMNLTIAVAKIETKLSLTPPPALRPCTELTSHLADHRENKRPCPELSGHLADHKDIRSLWQKPLVAMIIDVVKLIAIFVGGMLIAKWGAG